MAKNISNMDQLQAALMPTMVKMVDELSERVYQTLNYFLQEYYNLNSALNYNEEGTGTFILNALKIAL